MRHIENVEIFLRFCARSGVSAQTAHKLFCPRSGELSTVCVTQLAVENRPSWSIERYPAVEILVAAHRGLVDAFLRACRWGV
jgi:hypothetical protein